MDTLTDLESNLSQNEYSLGSQRSLLFSCPLSPSFFRRKRSKKCITSKTKEDDDEKKEERPTLRRRRSVSRFFLSRGRSDDSQGGDTVSSLKDNDENFRRLLEKAKQLDQTGNQFFQQEKYQDSLKSYTEALNLKRIFLGLNDEDSEEDSPAISEGMKVKIQSSMATTINNIAFLYQRIGSGTRNIISVYEESLRIKKKYLGNNHLSVGTTLNNIGSVYFSKKSFDKALIAYQQALDILVLNLGNFHLDVATVYSNIGDLYFSTKKIEEAGISYDKALRIRWSELGAADNKKDPKVICLLERISTIDLAKMTMELKELEENREDIYNDGQYNSDDEYFPDEDSYQKLKEDTKTSLQQMERIERKLELEMYRDKIKMAGDIRNISTYKFSEDEEVVKKRQCNNMHECEYA